MASSNAWYGCLADKRDRRDFNFKPKAVHLPDKVDLREHCPRAMNQLAIGSCVSQAITAALRFIRIKEGLIDVELSRLQLYYDAREMENSAGEDAGCEIRDGIKSAAKNGVAGEYMWPYQIGDIFIKPPLHVYAGAISFGALVYERVEVNPHAIKAALAQGYPVVIGVTLYSSFESDAVSKTGVVPMPDVSREGVVGGHCLLGSTRIPLLNGSSPTIAELAEAGGEHWVYSVSNNGQIVPGRARHARLTGRNRELVRVNLDDGGSFICTPDHRIMLRDGSYVSAGALPANASLMPLYKRVSAKPKQMSGYEKIYNPATNRWGWTHRIIASHGGSYDGVVHHIDFNKLNNAPDNLAIMSWDEHTRLHAEQPDRLLAYAKSDAGRSKSRELMKANWSDPAFRERHMERMRTSKTQSIQYRMKPEWRPCTETRRRIGRMYGPINVLFCHTKEAIEKNRASRRKRFENDKEYAAACRLVAIANISKYNAMLASGELTITDSQREARRQNAIRNNKNRKKNHSVVSVEQAGYGDVYDLEVDQYHNFAIGAGVFVHNCMLAVGYGQRPGHFTVRNSWGAWGADNAGDCFLPEQYLGSQEFASDLWQIRSVGPIRG